MIDPFRLTVAVVPLALYFLWLGRLNLRSRPTVVSGTGELILLSLAIVGLMVIGPLELFMPEAAAAQFRLLFWPMMLSLYGLNVSLVILMSRPRLVVHNATPRLVRKLLDEIALRHDPEVRWSGDSLAIPKLGIQFRIEEFHSMRNVAIISNGERQSPPSWRHLQSELEAAVSKETVPPNPRGFSLLFCGSLLLGICAFRSFEDLPALAQGFSDLLRL